MNLSEVIITRAEGAVLIGTRPRVVGRNAVRDVHGQFARDAVVRLTTTAGVAGWGWSNAKPETAQGVIGRRLSDVFDPQTGTRDDALAFDFPLWDLAGRVLGKPVYTLLGNGGTNPVPVYDGSIYIDELDPSTGDDAGIAPMLDAVRTGYDAGHRAFKVKIGRGHRWMEPKAGFRRDVDVVRGIRELIGNGARLLLDANNGYTPDEARALMREVADCAIYWFEEPFPEEAEACVAFRGFLRENGWNTLVADGEGSDSRETAFTAILRAGGVDVVQFDLRGYSLTRWLRYLRVIDETGTLAAPHNWGSHLSGFYIAHFGRGCPRFAMGETDPMTMPAVDSSGYRLAEGVLRVPDTPGFGLELDPDALRGETGWSVS